jgi:glutathione synthase/RimK-type ligase-like ATP-grasp enzyme
MKHLTNIGNVELVSLPDERLTAVPAKIDTGADSSAIWASDIKEESGQLSFLLFDKKSPFYSGKKHETGKYGVVSIKNSFGKTEVRYRVPLVVDIAGRRIRARVTLADRSNNKYPILIGRKTLSGKFLVNVSHKPDKANQRVLMLTTKYNEDNKKFADAIERGNKKLKVTYITYDDLCFLIEGPDSRIIIKKTNQDIAGFDLVFFKSGSKYMDVVAAMASYLDKSSVPYIPRAVRHFPGTSKLYQYFALRDSGLAIPRSLYMMQPGLKNSYGLLKDYLGLPFILKDNHGRKGMHNYLINDKKGFDQASNLAAQEEKQLIGQKFIPNIEDYRVLVFGTKIGLVIRRTRLEGKSHLNNTSQGATSAVVPLRLLPPSVQKACVNAAKLLERQVAGVDIVQDKVTGLWYCLEVNNGPQLATGSSTEEKTAAFTAYLERKLLR